MQSMSEKISGGIRVWLVEDDLEYRNSIVYLLTHASDVECTGSFASFEEIIELIDGESGWEPPNVVLMDIGLPGTSGIEGIRLLKEKIGAIPIIMLTIRGEANFIFDAFSAGASGYLLKTTPVDRILDAIREASRGGTLMPAPVASKVLSFFARSQPPTDYNLTSREMHVLARMAEGHSHKQIADLLNISVHTVENHLRRIYEKLHVNSGIQAVAKALKERIV
jgi:DNA-binding NarL/FixJ family response regulator